MSLHKIAKGMVLPISGEPDPVVCDGVSPRSVALVADDYAGMKPTMHVSVGDRVLRGQLLFEDKKTAGLRYTAPACGTVCAIHRGERRALQTVVIAVDERGAGGGEVLSFGAYSGKAIAGLGVDDIKGLLLESGLWTALRGRPFGKVANPAAKPHSIFVTAMDTNPLAPSPDVAYKGNEEAFANGLVCVSRLTVGKTFLCKAPGSAIAASAFSGVSIEEFAGVHPAGTVGVHIHVLDPVHRDKTVWYVGYQDVIAIGKLFMTGRIDVSRVISLAGPGVKKPRLLRTRLGASLDDLTAGEISEGEQRVISGSVFSGRSAMGAVHGYLGRYHNQVTVLPEDRRREFLGWLAPGANQFSLVNAFASCLNRYRKREFTTALHGSARAMVPIGLYERVFPMDILPTFLLRSLLAGDLERAEELGCLELEEEDVALCTFVSPSKIDYGTLLRRRLTEIEKEG